MKLWDLIWPHETVPTAFVGGGGKTTALSRLGGEARDRGTPIVLTVTTKWSAPPLELPVSIMNRTPGVSGSVPQVAVPHPGGITQLAGPWLPEQSKFAGISSNEVDDLVMQGVSAVAVEADGSRGRPLKVPGTGEPVIPSSCLQVVCITGFSALNRPMNPDNVHRWERYRALTGAEPGEFLTPDLMATLLSRPNGSFKGAPDKTRRIWLINQADSDEEVNTALAFARNVQALLQEATLDTIAVASLQSPEDTIREHLR